MNKNKVIEYSLSGLFLFLPFSSWLVSLTGIAGISLLRDIFVLIIFVFSLSSLINKRRINFYIIPVLIFVLWALISIFWREASLSQWAKGVRLLTMPMILFLSLQMIIISKSTIEKLNKLIVATSLVVATFAILEIIGIKLPLTTALSGNGMLEADQMVGALGVSRVSSIMAGPNAMGLYMLVMIAITLGSAGFLGKRNSNILTGIYSVLLFFTFSRSALIGLLIFYFSLLILQLYKKKGAIYSAVIGVFVLIVLSSASLFLYHNSKTQDYLTHSNSSSLRVEQYRRIWNEKYEIGLMGRGTGTAGPSSQFRLDGGENHWTENIYFDIFEELGLIGLLLYLFIVFSVLIQSYRKMNTDIGSRIVLLLSLSFLVTGIFINYYTGQVAIFLFWLLNGLTLKEQYGKNSD